MKILLIGEVYSSNLGDGIICETAYSLIKNQFLDIEIDFFDLTFRNNFLEYRNFNLSINEKNNKKNIKQIICDTLLSNSIGEFILKYKEVHSNKDKLGILYKNKYDLCVFVGGSLFMDYFCLPIYKIIKTCDKRDIPIIFNSCGISNNENIIFKKLMSCALKKSVVKYVSLRDGYESFQKRYHYNSEIIKSHDIAINCSTIYSIQKLDCSQTIGLGVMYIEKYEKELFVFWRDVIKNLEKRNIKYKVFCNGDIYDYNFINKMYVKGIFKKDKIEIRPKKPIDLVDLIANYRCVISFRLHSHIIAASLEIPSVAIVWNAKVIEFFNQINRSECCFYIQSDIDEIIDCALNTDIDTKSINHIKKQSSNNMYYLISKILCI